MSNVQAQPPTDDDERLNEPLPQGMQKWLPFLFWLPEIRKPGSLRADLMAGLTGAIVVLPQGVAFATLAGLPPQYGLYSAMVPCIIAALLGSSRQMVTGPANAISLTVLALIGPLAAAGSPDYVSLVLTLTFMVGCWQIVIGLSGLGRWVEKIPHAVIIGFTSGAAILIINSQVRHFFGFDWSRGMSVFETVMQLPGAMTDFKWPYVLVSGGTVVACIVARRFGTSLIPYMLVGVLGGSLIAFGLRYQFGADWVVPTIDKVSGALPPLSWPDFRLDTFRLLLVPSLIMTLLALAEAMSIATAVAVRNNRQISGTQEILAQGAANLGGSFFSAYPTSGSFNRSGLNVEAGARTPLSAASAGVMLMVLLAFVAPWFEYMPMAAVAGILVMVAWTLMDFGYARKAFADRRSADFVGWLVTFVLTVSVSLEVAIVVGLLAFVIVKRVLGARSSEA